MAKPTIIRKKSSSSWLYTSGYWWIAFNAIWTSGWEEYYYPTTEREEAVIKVSSFIKLGIVLSLFLILPIKAEIGDSFEEDLAFSKYIAVDKKYTVEKNLDFSIFFINKVSDLYKPPQLREIIYNLEDLIFTAKIKNDLLDKEGLPLSFRQIGLIATLESTHSIYRVFKRSYNDVIKFVRSKKVLKPKDLNETTINHMINMFIVTQEINRRNYKEALKITKELDQYIYKSDNERDVKEGLFFISNFFKLESYFNLDDYQNASKIVTVLDRNFKALQTLPLQTFPSEALIKFLKFKIDLGIYQNLEIQISFIKNLPLSKDDQNELDKIIKLYQMNNVK